MKKENDIKILRARMVKDHATWMALEYSMHVSAEVKKACDIAANDAKKSAKAYAKKLLKEHSEK